MIRSVRGVPEREKAPRGAMWAYYSVRWRSMQVSKISKCTVSWPWRLKFKRCPQRRVGPFDGPTTELPSLESSSSPSLTSTTTLIPTRTRCPASRSRRPHRHGSSQTKDLPALSRCRRSMQLDGGKLSRCTEGSCSYSNSLDESEQAEKLKDERFSYHWGALFGRT